MTEINAALFLKAAEELDRRGLNKRSLVDETYEDDPTNCKVCFWGAINAAATGDPGEFERNDDFDVRMISIIKRYVPRSGGVLRPGVAWNDAPDTTKEDVVAKLREIAASLS